MNTFITFYSEQAREQFRDELVSKAKTLPKYVDVHGNSIFLYWNNNHFTKIDYNTLLIRERDKSVIYIFKTNKTNIVVVLYTLVIT